MRVIKRYNNRKLYDTETRTYIALDGVAKLVVAGEEIRVVDNDTDEDLTSVILSQLLLEREREQSFIPSGMLSQLLRVGGQTGRKLGTKLTRPFTVPLAQLLEQEIERSFRFWMDMAQDREEDMLRLMERLIEQRRSRRLSYPIPERETPRKTPRSTNHLDDFEELTTD
jgi:polyhydroxyalkanoate synthesis repressor PhaR